MRTPVLAILLALSSTCVVACGADHHHPAAPSSSSSCAGVKAPGTATIGDKTLCPVSGEEFVVAADSPKIEVEGKTYYTCCGGCAKKFKADPKKYLDKLAKPTT